MNTDYMIIGLSGKIGSGKDYIAKNIITPILERELKTKSLILSFADSLKQECSLRYNLPYEKLYENKDNYTREKLQSVGTEFRTLYGKKVYVNLMKTKIKVHHKRNNIKIFIIPDVRYKEEYNFIRENNGIILRVKAPKRNHDKVFKECDGKIVDMNLRKNHSSETTLDNEVFDELINNDYDDDPTLKCYFIVQNLITNF